MYLTCEVHSSCLQIRTDKMILLILMGHERNIPINAGKTYMWLKCKLKVNQVVNFSKQSADY